MTGGNISCYRITGKPGAGGVGEVYRTRDVRPERDGAAKVLPAPLAQESAALAHFDGAEKAMAALSHTITLGIFQGDSHDPQK
jgi:eukaryotic-like serine/threonine-protein kinase